MKYALRAALIAFPLGATFASAQTTPVNLNTWSAQSYPAVTGFGAGSWVVEDGGQKVRQVVNGQPTFFASDFNAQGTEVRGKIKVTGSDDDYMGFALGYKLGDTTNPLADYLLVDWKQGNQFFDFNENGGGGTAFSGLAVSRVTGIPVADEFWSHTNVVSNANGSVQQLQRGLTLGSTGWQRNVEYDFRFFFTASQLQVFVNDVLQLDVNGSFSDGSMGFYNFSQAGVEYSAFTLRRVDVTVAPEPATFALMAAGLFVVGAATVKRRKV